jgi:hypothetical protein
MSNQCDAFDPNLDGVLQRCVLREGHSGPHRDEDFLSAVIADTAHYAVS